MTEPNAPERLDQPDSGDAAEQRAGTAPSDGRTPPAEGVAEFAAGLRGLRLEAGSPTLAKLHNLTGISRTVLSDAFAGRQLPSARTVDGIVRACGGESAQWVAQRDELAGLLARRTEPVEAAVPAAAADEGIEAEAAAEAAPVAPSKPAARRHAAWAVGGFLAGALVVGTVAALVATSVAGSRVDAAVDA
ncbi:helix-turn-helix domain-containing protein, partial [Agromyces seonyuensis]